MDPAAEISTPTEADPIVNNLVSRAGSLVPIGGAHQAREMRRLLRAPMLAERQHANDWRAPTSAPTIMCAVLEKDTFCASFTHSTQNNEEACRYNHGDVL